MTGALLALAGALLLWPGRGRPLGRVLGVREGSALGDLRRWARVGPVAAGVLAAGAGLVAGTPLVAALAGGCALLGVRAALAARRRGAEEAGLLGLAEALGVLTAELAAGRPPVAAVATAAANGDGRTGALLAAALAEDADPHPDAPTADGTTSGHLVLHRIRAAVRLSGSTGCSLTDVLTAVEDDLRARHRRRLELRTATAGPRAAAALLAGLPLLGLAMGAGIGAHPWEVLTGTAAGQAALVTGVLLELAGVGWVGRLLRRATDGPEQVGGR